MNEVLEGLIFPPPLDRRRSEERGRSILYPRRASFEEAYDAHDGKKSNVSG